MVCLGVLPGCTTSARREWTARSSLSEKGIPFSGEAYSNHVQTGSIEIVKLFENGGLNWALSNDAWEPHLMWAIRVGNFDVVEREVKTGININGVFPSQCNAHDLTPLMVASLCERIRVLEYLLDKGADIEGTDDFGYETPLLCAIRGGKMKSFKSLIERGANVQSKHTRSPLLTACLGGQKKMVEYLLDMKVDPYVRDSDGNGCVSLASRCGSDGVLKVFLERNLEFDADELQKAVLQAVWNQGTPQTIRLLDRLGADISWLHMEPLTVAISLHRKLVAKELFRLILTNTW